MKYLYVFLLISFLVPLFAMNSVPQLAFERRAQQIVNTGTQEQEMLLAFEQLIQENQGNPLVLLAPHSMVLQRLARKPLQFFSLQSLDRWKEVVKAILNRSRTADFVTFDGTTPLYWAVKNKHVWLVSLLLMYGANAKRWFIMGVSIPSNLLHVAVRQYKKTELDDSLIELLLGAGVHPCEMDGSSKNAIQMARHSSMQERLRAYADQYPFVPRFNVVESVTYDSDRGADSAAQKEQAYGAVVEYSNYVATKNGMFDLPETGCPICYDGVEEDVALLQLPCHQSHSFHAECIKSWFQQKANCPVCRGVIDAEQTVLLYSSHQC